MLACGRRAETGPGARCYNGLAAFQELQELYVVGGCCGTHGTPNNRVPLDSVIVYSMRTGTWRLAPPLRRPRAACVASAVGGRVYAMGSADDGCVEVRRSLRPFWRPF